MCFPPTYIHWKLLWIVQPIKTPKTVAEKTKISGATQSSPDQFKRVMDPLKETIFILVTQFCEKINIHKITHETHHACKYNLIFHWCCAGEGETRVDPVYQRRCNEKSFHISRQVAAQDWWPCKQVKWGT